MKMRWGVLALCAASIALAALGMALRGGYLELLLWIGMGLTLLIAAWPGEGER
jgi:hypothetical protein